ncbi:MAG TPA: GNAT family N-acetyltransferase [Polyangiaceae bacterium]|nr:GNAT family N-acetyltransferase [Polyangiaceae bacterium]
MRSEQLRTEAEYTGFFRNVVVPRSDLWLATLEGRVAGVLALYGSELDRSYVAPEAQNRGLGSALVQHAQRLHPTGLTLVTHQRNTGARRLYERHGFDARRYGTSPPPENEPDVEYEWPGMRSHRLAPRFNP